MLLIPADTTGTLDDDNAASLYFQIWLHSGSTYNGGTFAANWASSSSANRASSNNTSFFDSTDRTFLITGFQVEVGSQATPFEHRSFGEELALCHRYFYKHTLSYLSGYSPTSTRADIAIQFPCEMRVAPTAFTAVGTASHIAIQYAATAANCNSAVTVNFPDNVTSSGSRVQGHLASGLTVGQGAILYNADADANDYHLTFSSEL